MYLYLGRLSETLEEAFDELKFHKYLESILNLLTAEIRPLRFCLR